MLEKIKSLSLKWKFGFIIFFVLLIVVGILLITLRGYLTREFEMLYGAPGAKGEFIAALLAEELQPIVNENLESMDVEQTVKRYKSVYSAYGVGYIIVHHSSGEVISDTLPEQSVAAQLVNVNPLAEDSPCVSFSTASGQTYYDCAASLELPDEDPGAVRIGILEQNADSAVWDKFKNSHVKSVFTPLLILSVVLVILITVLLTLAFWFFVVRRIIVINQATERMSFGDLETPVDVRTPDEIGVLEDTLERTRANLKDAIERLKRRR